MQTRPRAVSQLLSLLVAGFSFTAVWAIAGTLTGIVPALGLIASRSESFRIPGRATGWAAVALACVVALYSSVPVARFIARAFPVKVNGRPRHGVIFACGALAATYSGVVASGPFLQENFMQVVPWTVLVMGTIAWTLVWQTRTTRALDVPYILFLRRFSSFGDRSLLTALLRSRPSGYRTAFLAPPTEAAANFSPVVVAFSGTRLRRPLASCPIPLAARNVEWEDTIEDLAAAAACVVIDPSDRSPAIEREIEIVQRAVSPDRVLWLADEAVRLPGFPAGDTSNAVRYRRSWRAAIPRIVLETLAVAVVAAVILGPMAGDPQFASVPPWLFWLAGLALVALAAPVILQPSVNREARVEMKRALRAILAVTRPQAERSRFPDWRRLGCAIVQPSQSQDAEFLADTVRRLGFEPRLLRSINTPRALREAIESLHRAALVIVDLSEPDADVEYLLGVAHGLGRTVTLLSREPRAPTRGAAIYRFTPGSAASSADVAQLLDGARRDPFCQGPVAAVLADRWVFGAWLTGRRTIAFVLDTSLSGGVALAYLAWQQLLPATPFERVIALVQATFLILIAYRFLCLALSGTTLGMALAGLRLVDADGGPVRLSQALGRSLALYATLVPFASSLAVLFGPRHQVLEDVVSGTRVVPR